MDRAKFIKWDNGGTPAARNFIINSRFIFNVTKEGVNIFRRHLQEKIMAFHPKGQVWKYKHQYCPYPSKVGYGMYCANNIQMIDMIINVLEVTEKENCQK